MSWGLGTVKSNKGKKFFAAYLPHVRNMYPWIINGTKEGTFPSYFCDSWEEAGAVLFEKFPDQPLGEEYVIYEVDTRKTYKTRGVFLGSVAINSNGESPIKSHNWFVLDGKNYIGKAVRYGKVGMGSSPYKAPDVKIDFFDGDVLGGVVSS